MQDSEATARHGPSLAGLALVGGAGFCFILPCCALTLASLAAMPPLVDHAVHVSASLALPLLIALMVLAGVFGWLSFRALSAGWRVLMGKSPASDFLKPIGAVVLAEVLAAAGAAVCIPYVRNMMQGPQIERPAGVPLEVK